MDDKSSQAIAVVIIFLILPWITIALRIYTRIYINRSFAGDDIAILILQVLFNAFLVTQFQVWKHGKGRRDSDLTPEDRSIALMWWWIGYIVYIINVCLFKICIGSFLLRIAVHPVHLWILRILTYGSVAIFGIVYLLLIVFQCQPPASFWRESPRAPGKCWPDSAILTMDLMGSIVDCGGDWTFAILPIFIVRSLNMRKWVKIMVMCLLGFGAVGSIATFVRIFYLPRLLKGEDFLYNSTEVAMLSTIESGVGITAVSLMTLQPLYEHWRRKLSGSTYISDSAEYKRGKNEGRSSYMKTTGSDCTQTPRLRPDNVTSISKASGPMTSQVSTNFTSTSLPSDIPLADRTDCRGIIRTREVIQSRLDPDQISEMSLGSQETV